MTLYDTHAHIDQLENPEQALAEAAAAGVKGIVAISMNLQSCRDLLRIRKQFSSPRIVVGLGMHPSEIHLSDLDAIVQLIKDNREHIHAVGEIGLDYWYKWVRKDEAKKEEQRTAYRTFLQTAKDCDLPAVIHSRGAWQDCLDIARDVGVKRAEFHWYSGPVDILKDILDAGFYVSTSPSVAYSPQSREAMAAAPLDRTLIETDCPVYYQGREDEEGFRAEPKDVFRTLQAYCGLKKISEEEAAAVLNRNAEEFFRL